MTEPVIRFDDVTKVFQRPDGRGVFVAVDKLSFDIGKGEIARLVEKATLRRGELSVQLPDPHTTFAPSFGDLKHISRKLLTTS